MVNPAARNHSTSSTLSANRNLSSSHMTDQVALSNVAMKALVYRLLYTTDATSQGLATLLSFFGQSKIPVWLLRRAQWPVLFWDLNGEIGSQQVNTFGVGQDDSVFDKSICELCRLRAICVEGSTDATKWISVNSQVLTRVASKDNCIRWKIEAVKVVFHAFPLDRRLVPQRSFYFATWILPLLKHVLPYLEETGVREAFSAAHIIEVLLSASYYSTLYWRNDVIAKAESIVAHYPVDIELQRRVQLRKNILLREFFCKWKSEMERLDLPRINQRSNSYYGEFVLVNADILLRRQKFQDALEELDKYTPLNPGHISTLEQIRIWEINLVRGKVHHFAGNFAAARGCLEEAVLATETSTVCKATSHLAIVFCELGLIEVGINLASRGLDDLAMIQSRESGSAKRLRLALAYTYLMEGMWAISTQPTASDHNSLSTNIQQNLDKAHELFRGLAQSYIDCQSIGRAGKTNRFSSFLGLALIAHIRGDLGQAYLLYNVALYAASSCAWVAGYIEAIIFWSKSVILYKRGMREDAEKLNGMAGNLYQCRSFFFPGMGTLWPKILRTWMAEQGREETIPE